MELRPALIDAAAAHRRRGRRVALLVRHAERDPISDLSRHEEAMLTQGGHAAAAASGRLLAAAIDDVGAVADAHDVVLVHSPIPRCRETALGLHKGVTEAGRRAHVEGERPALGASYLKDPGGLARAYLKHGKNFVRAWFDGEIDPAYIDRCDVVAERQLQALQQSLTEHALVVAVSHDWNIAAIKEHSLGLRFEDAGWPKFLDGVVAWIDDVRPRVVVEHVD